MSGWELYNGLGVQHRHELYMVLPAEQSSRSRRRSRERKNAGGRALPRSASVRSLPSGPPEEQDWMQALENVTDCLDSVERKQRMTAQTLNHFHEELGNGAGRLRETVLDIAAYKSFISTAHVNLD